jgi:hypothetical protein
MSGHLDTASECPVTGIGRQNIQSLWYSVRMSGQLDTASECPVTGIERQNIQSLGCSVRMSGHLDTASECPVTWIQRRNVRWRRFSVRLSGHVRTVAASCSGVPGFLRRSSDFLPWLRICDVFCRHPDKFRYNFSSKAWTSSEIGLRLYQTTRRHITKRKIWLRNSLIRSAKVYFLDHPFTGRPTGAIAVNLSSEALCQALAQGFPGLQRCHIPTQTDCPRRRKRYNPSKLRALRHNRNDTESRPRRLQFAAVPLWESKCHIRNIYTLWGAAFRSTFLCANRSLCPYNLNQQDELFSSNLFQ